MTTFSKFSDKYIRNQDKLSDVEEALADLQADQEVHSFFDRFKDEDKFFKRVISKLTSKLEERYGS